MKSTIKFLAVVMVFAAVPVFGQSKQADLNVSAQVVANCTISTLPVNFGTYDPLSATADDDGVGSITVACTRGIPTLLVEIDNGTSGVRQMSDGGVELLSYQLYSDVGRASVWGTGAAGVDPGAVNPAGTTLSVYGRIPAAQDVAVGNYAQTLQAIINY